MKNQSSEQIRFFLYLTRDQAAQVGRLRAAGVSASTIARQAIRKYHTSPSLLIEDDTPRPERSNAYISVDDAAALDSVALREGCSRAQALRRIIATYLLTNASAIDALF